MKVTRRGRRARSPVAAGLLATLASAVLVTDVAEARPGPRLPRVEGVAVEAVVQLGADAPAAIVGALAAGDSLQQVVRSIRSDTLAAPQVADAPSAPPTSAPGAAGRDAGNPVVEIGEHGIDPAVLAVDPGSPLIVANRGRKTHVVEIKGTDLEKYSLEPGLVGVYELEELPPGRYTLRCIVAGHHERGVLTIPGASSGQLRMPVGAKGARPARLERVPVGRADGSISADDYVDNLFMFDAIIETMAREGNQELEARRMRTNAARDQRRLTTTSERGSDAKATVADPIRIVSQAEKRDVDPAMVLLTNAILLAARNGYDADQITDFLLDDALDPRVWDTGIGLIRDRDAFVLGGVIPGVRPNGKPVSDVLAPGGDVPKREPVTEAEHEQEREGAVDAAVAGRYRGEFTGALIEASLALSPGATKPISNRVEVTIHADGTMRFTLDLVMPASWVTEDDTVTCASRYDLFATVTPAPRAELRDDHTFESRPFDFSSRQTDFTGPSCGSHVYSGENDHDSTGAVLVGTVEGDEVRGYLPITDEEGGAPGELEFHATRTRR